VNGIGRGDLRHLHCFAARALHAVPALSRSVSVATTQVVRRTSERRGVCVFVHSVACVHVHKKVITVLESLGAENPLTFAIEKSVHPVSCGLSSYPVGLLMNRHNLRIGRLVDWTVRGLVNYQFLTITFAAIV